MRSGRAPPGDHLVLLGHLIMHDHHQIGEGGVRRGDRCGIGPRAAQPAMPPDRSLPDPA
jgi:hypothetical protein